MRTIGVVTVGRSDYGIYLPILRRIEADADLQLLLYVSGMHLSPEFGLTVEQIEADGFAIHERVEILLSSDSAEGVSKSMGLGTIGFAQTFGRQRPDVLLVLGDRFEMHAAAIAAVPFKIPVAHIHGGELSEGAIDDALRHSITKMSHLHFVSTEDYARRVIQMGEDPWRVLVSGAPSLDNLKSTKLLTRQELEQQFDLDLEESFLLVTYHPVTLESDETQKHVIDLLLALAESGMATVFTYPNADAQGRMIIDLITEFSAKHENSRVVANLGTQGWFSLMKIAAAMVGNSSSGIIEAASFGLPVVNIGNRQRGRLRAANVIDAGYSQSEIAAAISRAVQPDFRAGLANLVNKYGDGQAADRIVESLRNAEIGDKLLLKRFYDQ
jgi:UDP-hydrolysing UDP-N-acetyl-D-glucosamine 2-epimerase